MRLSHVLSTYPKVLAAAFVLPGRSRKMSCRSLIGFCRAARDFDPDGEIPFDAYTAICIRRHLIDAAKSASRENTSRSTPMFHSIPQRTPQAITPFRSLVLKPPLIPRMRLSTEKLCDLQAIELTPPFPSTNGRCSAYLEGKSYKVIALSAGKSIKSVDNAVSRIRRKLSALLSQDSVK